MEYSTRTIAVALQGLGPICEEEGGRVSWRRRVVGSAHYLRAENGRGMKLRRYPSGVHAWKPARQNLIGQGVGSAFYACWGRNLIPSSMFWQQQSQRDFPSVVAESHQKSGVLSDALRGPPHSLTAIISHASPHGINSSQCASSHSRLQRKLFDERRATAPGPAPAGPSQPAAHTIAEVPPRLSPRPARLPRQRQLPPLRPPAHGKAFSRVYCVATG